MLIQWQNKKKSDLAETYKECKLILKMSTDGKDISIHLNVFGVSVCVCVCILGHLYAHNY